MVEINQCTLAGRLVRDPYVKNGNESNFAFFTLAVNHRYKDKNGIPKNDVAFVLCKTFGGWVESVKSRKKGDALLVTGRFRTETWEKNGVKTTQLALMCATVHCVMQDRRNDDVAEKPNNSSNAPEVEVPF